MTKTIAMVAALACVFGVSACDQFGGSDTVEVADIEQTTDSAAEEMVTPEAAPKSRPVVTEKEAEIDWAAARKDLASIPSEAREDSFQIASGNDAPPVPVLLPTGIVMPAGAENQIKFQPLSDGYFAAYPGVTYDVIVNGTNEVMGDGARSAPEDRAERFLATASGAQVAFSRYGADYLVEFECNEIDGETGTCLTEDEAVEVARKLVIAGTR